MANERVWKVFTFAGWWLVFLGVALISLFLVSNISTNVAAIALTITGFILAIIGEAVLSQHHDKKHRFVWEGISLGGIFLLSSGLLWIASIYAQAQQVLGLFVLIVIGIVLVFLGETQANVRKSGKKK